MHPDIVPANVILRPERGIVIVDWAGSGRGPRLWSLGFLLWAAGHRDLALVDAVITRYSEHVQLTGDELARLPDAIRARPLTMDCWSVVHERLSASEAIERIDACAERAEQIADRVRRIVGAGTHGTATIEAPITDRRPDVTDRDPAPRPPAAHRTTGEFLTETIDYDGGRQVTVYLPAEPPEAIVFAGDGHLIGRWGTNLETADLPPTAVVGVYPKSAEDEMARIAEYSPTFDEQRFAAHESFFVNDVRRWVRSRFGIALPPARTAVCGVSASGEFSLAMGLRHPDIYGVVFSASPGAGYRPPAVMPSPLPRTYLVVGTLEPFFLENATRWADALRAAGADVIIAERVGNHGDPFWAAEFPQMIAWAFAD